MTYKNWIPYEITAVDRLVRWLYLGEKRYLEPFFEETISICRRQPENYRKNTFTSLNELEIANQELASIPPTAFIFHISRCGSTMLTQLLSLQEENIVVAEAPIFDSILRWKYNEADIPDKFRYDCLKKCVNILGQKRFAVEQHYFIKLDSWHLFFIDEIRAIYPDTPFIFMTRDLSEVMESHKKMPGMQAVPGMLEPAIFGLPSLQEVLHMQAQDYLELVLKKMLEPLQLFATKNENYIHLKYEDGMSMNFEKTLNFLNLKYNLEMQLKVNERLKFHSKIPKEQFEPAI